MNYKFLENKNLKSIDIYYKRVFFFTKKEYFTYQFLLGYSINGFGEDFLLSSLIGYNKQFYGIESYANLGIASSVYGKYNKIFALIEIGTSQRQNRINIGINSRLFLHPSETVKEENGTLTKHFGPLYLKKRAYLGLGLFLAYSF